MEHITHHGHGPGPAAPERPALTPETRMPAGELLASLGEARIGTDDASINDDATERKTAADKATATLQARAALAGFELVKLPDGYVISRWGESKHLADPAAVHAFLVRVGAPS
jgi:hypothetical protein